MIKKLPEAPMKWFFLYAAAFFVCAFLLPDFYVYGIGHARYLDWRHTAVVLFLAMPFVMAGVARSKVLTAGLLVGLLWVLATHIHAFPGDGATQTLQEMGAWHFRRLDDLIRSAFAHLVLWWNPDIAVLPSVFAHQLYSWFFGAITVGSVIFLEGRRAWMILTMPFMLVFFGNVDSYAAPICMALLLGIWWSRLLYRGPDKRDALAFASVCALAVWMHPFGMFLMPLVWPVVAVAWASARAGLPCRVFAWWPILAWALQVIAALYISGNGSPLFKPDAVFAAPAFSCQTLTHYLNSILLPLLPLLIVAVVRRWRFALKMFVIISCIFPFMRFTIGAADQWNYYHLLVYAFLPFMVHFRTDPLPVTWLRPLVAAQLLILVPAVLVNSTAVNIDRARAVYPSDRCHHNMVMSWQTHLGIVLMDNLQKDPKLARTVPEIFFDGTSNADERFRTSNLIYGIASLYHYQRFDEGKQLLQVVVKQEPRLAGAFLAYRPGFAYCNRERLWKDLGELFGDSKEFQEAVARARVGSPYATRPFEWEVQ